MSWLTRRIREQARSHIWIAMYQMKLWFALALAFDLRHTEPRPGAECWGEDLLVTFGPFQK